VKNLVMISDEGISSGHRKWLETPGKRGQKHNDSTMRKFDDFVDE